MKQKIFVMSPICPILSVPTKYELAERLVMLTSSLKKKGSCGEKGALGFSDRSALRYAFPYDVSWGWNVPVFAEEQQLMAIG